MQNTSDQIFFNFSYFALKLLGKGLYSNPWTAIAELVANGIDAHASNVKIYINMCNKKNSIIEIFDNGSGMDYEDLAEKYVLIGKNKRAGSDIDEDTRKQLMGRKGIGKLAALYLSNKYYLVSKTMDESSAWCLDMAHVNDSDIPQLSRIELDNIKIVCNHEWSRFATGTMIRLTNVDMTNIGVQTIDGLKARLADFYLLNALKCKIDVAVQMSQSDPFIFYPAEKSIAFKNMYSFFDNTELGYTQKLSADVYISSNSPEIDSKRREVKVLQVSDFKNLKGERRFVRDDGTLTDHPISYEMRGWLGIHTSINKADAEINDPNYLKNKAYRPNQLRLYVRNKLAVENFLDYIKNTQAFSNYIEGEICFDILDDDELGDIATSNRQGFVEDSERVQLLIEILKPIINALITARIKIGNQVRAEEFQLQESLRQAEEEEKLAAQQAQLEAEREKKLAQKEVERLHTEVESATETLGSEKKRSRFLSGVVSESQLEAAKRMHMIKTNTITIRNSVSNILMKKARNRLNEQELMNALKRISYCSERIFAMMDYGVVALFDPKEESINNDLFQFVQEYCDNILATRNTLNVITTIVCGISFETTFSPQDIGVLLENVFSNSEKNNSANLCVRMQLQMNNAIICFEDDGDGLGKAASQDIDSLFEFGKSFTKTGTGVGLYHIKNIVETMGGTVVINQEKEKGFELQVRLPHEI